MRFLFSLTGRIDQYLDTPLAVTVSRRGLVYVADGGYRSVQVFSPDGVWQRSIGRAIVAEPRPGDLVYPLGVAVDDQDNCYVSDNVTGRISVFDSTGAFLRYFAEDEAGAKPFGLPAGLFFRNGLLYVNDVGNHQVMALRSDGTIERVFGRGRGSETGQMQYPNFSWVDEWGRVYVADSNNNRIQIFGSDGAFQGVFASGHEGPETGVMRGIALDSRGDMHVVATMEHRVLVFDQDGQFMYSYGREGDGPGQLGFPNGLAVAGDQVYVADRANGRVQVWSLGAKLENTR